MFDIDHDQARWRHDYDQRQYRRMLERLEAFEAGKVSLHYMINDLETLLSALELPDMTWRREFQRKWGWLDSMRGVALVERGKFPSPEETQSAREIARELKALVLQKLELRDDGETTDEST
jgi:hypothetical protein